MKDTDGSSKSNGAKFVSNPNGHEGEPISLYPLTPDEAIRALLSVPPELKEKHQNEHK